MDTQQIVQIGAGLLAGITLAVVAKFMSHRRWRRSDERWKSWFPEFPGVPENPERLRQLAIGAILSENNAFPFNTLEPHKSQSEMREWLASAWDTSNSAQAREQIQALLWVGHAETFDTLIAAAAEGDPDASREHLEQVFAAQLDSDPELAEFINNHPGALARLEALGYLVTPADLGRGTRAYDLGRAVTVTRVAFGAGYLKREEALALISMAAYLSARMFASWREFATSYLLGRAVWGGVDDPDFEGMVLIANELLSNSRSPWVRYGWFK